MESRFTVRAFVDLNCVLALAFGCGASEHSNSDPEHAGSSATSGGAAPSSGGSGGVGAAGQSSNASGGRGTNAAAGVGATSGTAGATDAISGMGGGAECPSGTSNHTAGSRIQGRYAVTEDGNRYWLDWYDSELAVTCEFYSLHDGQIYCAPNAGSTSLEFYTDAGCTEQAYTRGSYARCAAMNFIFLYDAPACQLPPFPYYRFFDLGDAVPTPSQVYLLNGSTCVATTAPTDPLYRLGPEVDYATRFVSATYGPLAGGGRLQGYGVSANDGTRQLTRWRDNSLDMDCRLDLAEDGKRRCLPLFTANVQNFADAACSLPVAEPAYTCDDSAPAYAVQSMQQQCPASPDRLFTSGARFTDPVYTSASGSCSELTTGPTDAVHYATNAAAPALFQDVNVSVDATAPGRLKPQFATADGGCWFDGVWDSELETKCSFALASDGVERCLPIVRAYESVQAYADDACTVPRLFAGPFHCGATPVEPFSLVSATNDDCTYTRGVYRTGDLVTNEALGMLWQKSTTGCVQAQLPAGDYAPLTLMDPSAFVAATVVTE